MAGRPKGKMPVSERAKQFAPFSALRGLNQALSRVEKVREPRRELTDDRIEQINRALNRISPGDIVTLVYYEDEEYLQLTGPLTKLDEVGRAVRLGEKSVPIDDLYDVIIE